MLALIRNILVALLLAALGIFVLRSYPGTVGLCVGVGCVLAALAIAFPTQMHDGGARLKALIVMIVPTVFGAIPGGRRANDPPAAPADAPTDAP